LLHSADSLPTAGFFAVGFAPPQRKTPVTAVSDRTRGVHESPRIATIPLAGGVLKCNVAI
jgi:hypothetical protein